MLYCTYDTLNMFRALLYPSSGARDYMRIITAYGVQCLVDGCRGSVQGSRLCVQKEGCCTTCNIPLPGCTCTWPPTTSKQALHTIVGNNTYTGCNRRNGPYFGRVFLRSNYTDITQNTYIQSSMVTEILAREVRNIDSYYSLIDYQLHIETGRNMWFL